jgi:hypothetical protein
MQIICLFARLSLVNKNATTVVAWHGGVAWRHVRRGALELPAG